MTVGEYERRREITKKIAGIIPTSEDEKSRLLMSEYLLTQEEAEQF